MDREIIECFKVYKKAKVDEYNINFGEHIINPHAVLYKKGDKGLYKHTPFLSEEKMKELKEKTGQIAFPSKTLIHKSLVERLSPDNIDSRDFWKKATDVYPLFCICGGEPEEQTKESADAWNLKMAHYLGATKHLQDYINDSPLSYFNMLEIGPGFGNICNLVENTDIIKYHAIDVNPLFDHPRLYQTDGSTIPDEVPNELDVVYSINVFQHLSKKQRSAYYKQIHEKLKVGGIFIFSMFVCTEKNKDWTAWGVRDKDDRRYTFFFRQFTEVDFYDELKEEMDTLGFELTNVSLHEETSNALTFKCIKQ